LSAAERLQDGDDAAVVALDDLREFLSRDPAGSYRWADLGDALHRNGQIDKARYAFARAVTLAPNSPPTLLRAAGFYFDVGENPRVLDLASRSLQAGPEFDHESFVALEQIPVDEVLRYGLPDRRSSRAYLRQLMIGNGFADAGKAWSWMVSRGEVDDKLANEYVEFLFRNKKPEAAAEEWAVYSARQSTAHPGSNLVFNGDSESNPTGSRFDWKIETPPGAAIDF